jgi:penicillin amidase
MLANDPHRKIAVPSLRYIVHLVAPGWNVIGGGEPEIPGVSIGHNEKGAWGLTIFETDGEDLYVYDLNPKNLNQYWHKGKWVDMKIIQDSIRVKNSSTQKVSYAYTIHGPVTLIDSANHKAYAIRAAWMEPGGAPYLASLRIDQATNWEEFREACSYSHIPGENMIWADKKGNIGWQAVGIIPIRKNFSGYVPVPGDGRFEWDGFLPIKERPHMLNPHKGFFATANQHVTPETYPHWNAIRQPPSQNTAYITYNDVGRTPLNNITPEFITETYGIPREGTYYQTDRSRGFFKLPFFCHEFKKY